MTGPLIPEPWRHADFACAVCGRADYDRLKPRIFGAFWVEMNVGGVRKLCCPDCQRTVRAMRGLDGMVNGA